MTYAWYLMSGVWIYQAIHFQNRHCLLIAFFCIVNGAIMQWLKEKLK